MVIVLFARLIQFFVMAASVKIMTGLLSPSELGIFSLIMTITSFLALMLVNPVGMYINRFLHVWVEDGIFKAIFFRFFCFLIIVGFFSILILVAIKFSVTALDSLPLFWIILLVSGSLIFNSIVQTLIPSLNALGERKSWAFLSIAWVFTNLIFSVIAVLLYGNNAKFWLSGTLLGNVLFSLMAYKYFFTKFSTKKPDLLLNTFCYKSLAKFSVPIAFGVIAIWIQFQGYRIYLVDEVGLERLGFFFAGYSIAAWIMGAIEQIVMTAYQPDLYRDSHSSDIARVRMAWSKYSDRCVPYYLIGFASIVFLSDELVTILLSESYQSVGIYVVIGAFAEFARIWLLHINLLFHLEINTEQMLKPMLVGAFSTIVFTLLLAPLIGIEIAPVISTIITILITLYIFKRIRFYKQYFSFSVLYVVKTAIICTLAGLVGIFFAGIFKFEASSLSGSFVRITFFSVPVIAIYTLMTIIYKSKKDRFNGN